ncbi:hypothetical protein EON79_16050 [bacterium]|nr:MAG: hypothetical protein EON79_16050 [bacterium]
MARFPQKGWIVHGSTVRRSSRPVSPGSPASDYICLLVKNGPGTDESLPVFQIKKLIHGW